jgi:hypothetical protein
MLQNAGDAYLFVFQGGKSADQLTFSNTRSPNTNAEARSAGARARGKGVRTRLYQQQQQQQQQQHRRVYSAEQWPLAFAARAAPRSSHARSGWLTRPTSAITPARRRALVTMIGADRPPSVVSQLVCVAGVYNLILVVNDNCQTVVSTVAVWQVPARCRTQHAPVVTCV